MRLESGDAVAMFYLRVVVVALAEAERRGDLPEQVRFRRSDDAVDGCEIDQHTEHLDAQLAVAELAKQPAIARHFDRGNLHDVPAECGANGVHRDFGHPVNARELAPYVRFLALGVVAVGIGGGSQEPGERDHDQDGLLVFRAERLPDEAFELLGTDRRRNLRLRLQPTTKHGPDANPNVAVLARVWH